MRINLKGPGNPLLGYGHACVNILTELYKENDITYWPIGSPSPQDVSQKEIIQECVNKKVDFDHKAPSLTIWHEFDLAERIGSGLYSTLSFFEIDELNDLRINHMGSSDLIFTPSNWAKTIIERDVVNADVVVCPMGVNTEIFRPANKNEDKYIFFNLAKLEIRKGHDILHELFNEAFTEEDNVELWVSWNNPFEKKEDMKEWVNLYKNSKLGHKIKFINPCRTDQELARLMNSVSCGLFPTKAEGFGFPILQMMACGKPVITTNYSAHTEFCNEKNSCLVQIDRLEEAFDGKWFFGDNKWAYIGDNQKAQFVDYIRKCYKNRPQNKEGEATANELSWTRTCSIIREELSNRT